MGNEDTAALTHEKTVVNFYKIFKKRDCGSGESPSTVSFFLSENTRSCRWKNLPLKIWIRKSAGFAGLSRMLQKIAEVDST